MLVFTIILGILAGVGLIAALTAFHVLPTGRICAQCGVPTTAVRLRRGFSWAERWFHWRWCARCGWEGLGRRMGTRNLSSEYAEEMGGFRWSQKDGEETPVFYWKPEESADTHPSQEGPEAPDRRRRWGSGVTPQRRPEGFPRNNDA